MPDISAALWVEDGLRRDFARVGSHIPEGFASHARLFHPARGRGNERVRWAEVAKWSGRTVHPLMAFERISAPRPGHGHGDAPWETDPWHGCLGREEVPALAGFLGGFTETPERCFFGCWEGYGQFSSGATVMLSASGRAETLSPPPEVRTAQRLRGVGRAYLLYTGSLSAIESFLVPGWNGPTIWWPNDRAWCVATDIDLDSTYVGGTEGCMQALLDHPRFEALPITLDAPTYLTADTLNAPD